MGRTIVIITIVDDEGTLIHQTGYRNGTGARDGLIQALVGLHGDDNDDLVMEVADEVKNIKNSELTIELHGNTYWLYCQGVVLE